jgi:transcriptional regulator with XRE-family HTH domain
MPQGWIMEETIGSNIRRWRQQLGWSQADLGAKVGVSWQQIQKYEKQDHCEVRRLLAIAKELGQPLSAFLGPELVELERAAGALDTPDPLEVELLFWFRRLMQPGQQRAVGIIQGLAGNSALSS